MLTLCPRFVERIPARQKHILSVGWPFLLFVTSVTGLFFLDGKCVNEFYLGFYSGLHNTTVDTTKIDPSENTFISRLVSCLAALITNPLQGLCLLGVLLGMNQVHYRYFFRDALIKGAWGGWFGYAIALLAVSVSLTMYGTGWLGKDNRLAGDFTLWAIIFQIAYGTWSYFRETRKAQRALAEQATQAELAALKAQINPHFLFNSLNNIFGTALTEGGQRTPDGVQQLARLMRYQLEQTNVEKVDLVTEMGFLDEYVQFHRQLLPGTDALMHTYEHDEQPLTIAPLLLTPLVDYALQHRQPNVPIHSRLSVKDRFLHYQLTYPANANVPAGDVLTNVEQRLSKLYTYFTLNEKTAGQINTLDLTINL